MKTISIEERKKIQMDILSAVDKFCCNNNINYSLAAGTLIGAVRHGGFIPWDDDIDIYMLRDDYNVFEKKFPNCYQNYYKIWSFHRSNDCYIPFAKVYDNRTLIKERGSKSKTPGVFIDIFPVDEVPDEKKEWEQFNKKRLKQTHHIFRLQLKTSSDYSFIKNIGIILYRTFNFFSSPKRLVPKFINFISQHNGKGFYRVYENSMGFYGGPFLRSTFEEFIDVTFEDRKYKCFKNYHDYLSKAYGDYMTPPPPEQQVSNHSFDAYWK